MWESELVTILRHLIDDTDSSNYTYSDDRLITALLVGVQLVKTEISFPTNYSVDVDSSTINPDPTNPRDDNFIVLVCLRTAIMILGSALRAQSLSAIRVVDGPSSIDMSSSLDGIKALFDDISKRYEQAKLSYAMGEGVQVKAILTPFSPGSFGLYSNYYGCPRP